MPSMRDIRRRIRSIKSTEQITRAMKAVSAAKLRRAQENVLAARPFANLAREMLARVAASAGHVEHPLLEVREEGSSCFVVITADRGLCGGFNTNIIRESNRLMDEAEGRSLWTVGRKGRDFYKRREYKIDKEYVGIGEDIGYDEAAVVAEGLMEQYTAGEYKNVYLLFNRFINTLVQRPTVLQLLPVKTPGPDKGADPVEYTFEPSDEAVLEVLLPKYVRTMIYHALLESKAAEHSARMTAMDSATKNATEMTETLTLKLNRARQAAITKEISEIVGGSAALRS